MHVLLAPFLEVGKARREIHHIDVAPAEISEIVPVRLLLDVADAILRNDGAEAVAEAINRGGADAARGVAARDDDGVDALLGVDPCLEECRGCLLADGQIVARIMDPRSIAELG